ncbi:MAG: prenyltransferase/squalene oxidase repeat-containing protein [Kiritimatiellia bacterium]
MRDCAQASRAAEYVAGEMIEIGRRLYEAHLKTCPVCRCEVEATSRVIERLSSLATVTTSRDLAPEIIRRLKADRPRQLCLPVAPRVLMAAAAAIVISFGVLWFWRTSVRPANFAPSEVKSAESVTAAARKRAIRWLCRTQEPDGSWSAEKWGGDRRYDVAVSSLALLAILTDTGYVSEREDAVHKTIAYLLSTQHSTGEFGPVFSGGSYNHGIASLALLRAYNEQQSHELKLALDRALDVIRKRQNREGGWGYWGEAGTESNLSVTIWQLEALKGAVQLGWYDLHDNVRRATLWVASVADDQGMFGYRRAADFPSEAHSLTVMGALILMNESEPRLSSEQRWRMEQKLRQAAHAAHQEFDYYHIYFLIAALKCLEKEKPAETLATLRSGLVAHQAQRGANRGSWDPDLRWGSVGGRIYATALASLSLQ